MRHVEREVPVTSQMYGIASAHLFYLHGPSMQMQHFNLQGLM
jgi:hypothetical protein